MSPQKFFWVSVFCPSFSGLSFQKPLPPPTQARTLRTRAWAPAVRVAPLSSVGGSGGNTERLWVRYRSETGPLRALEAGPRGLNLKDMGVIYVYDFPSCERTYEGSDMIEVWHFLWDKPWGRSTDLGMGSWAACHGAFFSGPWARTLSVGKMDYVSLGLRSLLVIMWPQGLKLHVIQAQASLQPRALVSSSGPLPRRGAAYKPQNDFASLALLQSPWAQASGDSYQASPAMGSRVVESRLALSLGM